MKKNNDNIDKTYITIREIVASKNSLHASLIKSERIPLKTCIGLHAEMSRSDVIEDACDDGRGWQ